MSTSPAGNDIPVRRIDRILAFMSLGMVVLSIVCFVAIIIGTQAGADFSQRFWVTVGTIVYVAPILAFLLLMAVLIMTFVRKSRANKKPGKRR
ncbi:hypothetical protein [Microbacterium sp. No. 7]|uniref:hypothetical protein n=1 Tax=Microbacterium sp. No. 7 TaxID=1714373 RepID=UPI0006D1DC2A|nr:hypothetical protein [Microbacterium sp. No. 7]ALJ19662.1 multidrug ABC transporter ATPase [Microbacterium sp. No. 7]